eukprot:TRINITY_DN4915_c0_g1_i1.p3 TRINITY_DN4915_c0_g1~~TRINITY_DN4915_c0_g1_i1.p3  ORF type:complete len:137 (-),score=17.66 TRINITY_DN4915_c0_g1_i1:245-655(-)
MKVPKQVDIEDHCKHPTIEEEAKQIWKSSVDPQFKQLRLKGADNFQVKEKVKKFKRGGLCIEGEPTQKQFPDQTKVDQIFDEKLKQRKFIRSKHWGWTYDVWPDGMEVLPSHYKRFSLFFQAKKALEFCNQNPQNS